MTLDLTAGRADAEVDLPFGGGATTAIEGADGLAANATAHRHPIVGLAISRDLQRMTQVLAGPVTAVRRTALIAHATFLVEQARSGDDGPGRYPVALSRLGHEARLWARDPLRRPQVRGAAQAAARSWAPARAGSTPAAGPVHLRSLIGRRPTMLAYRYFWLVDSLPPAAAREVTDRYSGPARWVLRNVLSGGYNRRAYLMWCGGGSGPAV